LKKVCYKVSFCENYQRESCKAFIGLTIHAKNDWWGTPLLPEILGQTDRVGAKLPIFDPFSPVIASAVVQSAKLKHRLTTRADFVVQAVAKINRSL